ncbi:MAG: DUF6338 family protein [Actinomycetota bacterium]|nr:DUF6338 family protein [Actinomycetota bacterium]
MGPGTFEGLVIILLAVIPGYIAVSLWSRNKTWQEPPTDLKLVLLAVIVTGVIQLLLFLPLTSWWIWPVRDHLADHPVRVASWALVAVLLIPAVGGVYAGRLTTLLSNRRRVGFPKTGKDWSTFLFSNLFAPVPPSPWDKFFMEPAPNAKFPTPDGQFLIVTFTDGHQVAGVYYGPSWVATSPQVQGLFLAQEYTVENGQIGTEVIVSKGVLIPNAANISSVKVMASEPPPKEGTK